MFDFNGGKLINRIGEADRIESNENFPFGFYSSVLGATPLNFVSLFMIIH